jgi:hypothetical protein
MPAKAAGGSPQTRVEGTFVVSARALTFSNVKPNGSFWLINDNPSPSDFVITKKSHTGYGEQGIVTETNQDGNPLFWLEIGQRGELPTLGEFTVHLEPFSETEIAIQSAGAVEVDELKNRWEGIIEISNHQMGTREVLLHYVSRPEGQWSGTMYYFASFRDEGLEDWMTSKDTTSLENAFIVFWDEFAKGQRTFSQFTAMLTSTIDETWKYPWVEEYGNCSLAQNACFPDDSPEGYGIYTQDLQDKPIPSGALEFPIAINIKQKDSAASFSGRVVTDQTLHYVGDPAIILTFENDPASCTSNAKGVVICPLKSFDTKVFVGGRYLLTDPEQDPDCQSYADGSYDVAKVPWLIPDFTAGTTIEENLLYYRECKDTMLPFGDPLGDDGIKAINQSYAGSNPIPDGFTRERTITLVDGALINGQELFIIFKEHFGSFMGSGDIEGFSAYGIMRLSRSTAMLEPDDFEGSNVTEDRVFDDQLLPIGCNPELLAETERTFDLAQQADINALTTTMLYGIPNDSTAQPIDEFSEEEVHWLCQDTGLIDGRYRNASDDYQVPCPEDSEVIFFTIKKRDALDPEIEDIADMLTSLSCDNSFDATNIDYGVEVPTDSDGYEGAVDTFHNTVAVGVEVPGTCFETLQGWLLDTERYLNDSLGQPNYLVRRDPVWRCQDPERAYCSDDRFDLRQDKDFFEEASGGEVVFVHAQSAVADAFRYKTRFRSRTGKTVGFTPAICQKNSAAIPYCYDPAAIEKIAQRVDCMTYLYNNHRDDLYPDVKLALLKFLQMNFAYEMITMQDNQLLEPPIIHEGFERLWAELLIMMGDESYTNAFASRFDLAGSAIRSFEGTLFEPPDGINLSGGAGYEMYTLYQAVQYYQMALDRFYAQSPMIWNTLSTATASDSFITQETVTAYFDRLIRASTQKSRAWSEIAKRYQQFNRPDLARRVVARAYTSTYLESVVLSRMMLKMKGVVELADWPQISERVENAQRGYRSALLKMRAVYDSITDDRTLFGYAPDYIPFPAMDPTDTNAFEKALAVAKETLAVAAEKEVIALETRRSFDTEAEAFQSELVSIRNSYEGQLGDLCGTFEGADSRIYPAIPKYADMHEKLRTFPKNPCGLVHNGQIHQAMVEVDLAALNLTKARGDLEGLIDQIKIEQQRVEQLCSLIEGTANYVFDVQGDIIDLKDGIRAAEMVKSAAERAEMIADSFADMTKCDPLGDCATAVIGAGALAATYAVTSPIVIGSDIAITVLEAKIDNMENALSQWEISRECDYARVDSDALVRTLMLDISTMQVEIHKAMLRFKLASNKVVQLANQAQRLQDEQSETEQLSINVAAARNDPNSRIYKNDAILTADRTFETALKAAYRATRVYEYYTSQSYAPMVDLYLVRMISHGDITLESYISELEAAFLDFEDQYGNPDLRVEVVCLKDDIFEIERYDENQLPLTDGERTQLMRDRLADVALLDARGYLTVPFSTRLDQLCPLTHNHKIHYIEAQLLGRDLGDPVARVYLSGRGTGTLRSVEGNKKFYRFPGRTAVINTIVGQQRVFEGNIFDGDVYKNRRLRDMPLVNTGWELVINQRDELVNQDIDLQSLDDMCLYFYYTDFTELD